MIIDIFGLLPGAREVDTQNKVATVEFVGGSGTVTVFNEVRGRIVRELFENDFSSFQHAGDGVENHRAWSEEAIQQILREELPAFSLRGLVRS